jgi:hypothetical protein
MNIPCVIAKSWVHMSWKCRHAFEPHGCLTILSPPSWSHLFYECRSSVCEMVGLLNILCRRGMMGKCLNTFTGNFFCSWSLNLGLAHFGHVILLAYLPWKSTQPLSQVWMLLYANPNCQVNAFATYWFRGNELPSSSMWPCKMENSLSTKQLLTPCRLFKFKSKIIAASLEDFASVYNPRTASSRAWGSKFVMSPSSLLFSSSGTSSALESRKAGSFLISWD